MSARASVGVRLPVGSSTPRSSGSVPSPSRTPADAELDARLDEALDASFPASDPPAVHLPEVLAPGNG